MKTIIIPDLHGQDLWKKVVAKHPYEEFVFLGDYFDSFDDNPEQQKVNFEEIIEFKKANIGRVHLLIGNHDLHYMKGINDRYTGHQPAHHIDIQDLLEDNRNFLKVAYQQGKYLMTHAGVTNTWLRNVGYNGVFIVSFLNNLLQTNRSAFEFASGRNFSGSGDDVTQGPMWVRPRSLSKDLLEGYIHVVGHTVLQRLEMHGDYILVDTFQTSREYLVINEDETFNIKIAQ